MSVERAVAAVSAELGEELEVLLAEAGGADLRGLLAIVPIEALNKALAARPPGIATLLTLREHTLRRDDLRAAVAVTRTLIRWLGDRLGAQHADVLAEVGMLGVLADRSGRKEKGRELLLQAWTGLHTAGAPGRAVSVGRRLAELLQAEGDIAGAAELLETCWLHARATPAAGAVGLQRAELRAQRHAPGSTLHGRLVGEAASDAWAAHVATAGVAHPSTPALAHALGRMLLQAQRRDAAAEVLRAAVDRGRAQGWSGWPESAFLLVQALESTGITEEALRTLEDALRQARASGQGVSSAWLTLAARAMSARGRGADAEGLLLEALEVDRRAHGAASLEVASRQAALGRFYLRHGRVDDALGFLEPAVGGLRRLGPAGADALRPAGEDLVTALVARRSTARAQRDREVEVWCDAAIKALVGPVVPPDHPALRGR